MRIRNQKNRGKVQLRQGHSDPVQSDLLCPDFEVAWQTQNAPLELSGMLSSQLGFAGSTPLLVHRLDTVGLMGSHLSSPIKILNWWDSRVHWSYPLRLLVASSFWIMIEYCQSVWAATGYLSHAIANPQGSQRYPVMTHDPCPDSGCLSQKISQKRSQKKWRPEKNVESYHIFTGISICISYIYI